jgi:amino acid transporter
MSALIVVIYTAAFHATAFDSFLWSGTIGTLILLVVYVLATIGCTMLVFVRRKLPVPMWQIVVPVAAIIVLGYTLYRNVVALAAREGIAAPGTEDSAAAGRHRLIPARDEAL